MLAFTLVARRMSQNVISNNELKQATVIFFIPKKIELLQLFRVFDIYTKKRK